MKTKILFLTICYLLLVSCQKNESGIPDIQYSQLYYEYDYTTHTAKVIHTPDGSGSGYSNYSGNIVIPPSVTYYEEQYTVTGIGPGAFAECENLLSVKIPSTIIRIEEAAFSGSPKLESLSIDNGNPIYDSRYNCNAIIETKTNTLLYGCCRTNIPNNVSIIGEYSFMNLILERIDIPEGVQRIEHLTLWKLPYLKSIEIPNSVTYLGENVLSYCNSLESVILGSGIDTLYYDVLRNNPRLTTVVCKAIYPPFLNENVFSGIPEDAILYVPDERVHLYLDNEKWRNSFKEILPISSK